MDIQMPPPEFLGEPKQHYETIETSRAYLTILCGDKRAVACTKVDGNLIFILEGLSEGDEQKVLIHEKAHLNGWPCHPWEACAE